MLRRVCPVTRTRVPIPCRMCPVRNWTVCEALPRDQLATVETFKAGDRILDAGADVYREGEPWRELYTVMSGWMYLYKLLPDGRRQITMVALPGDFIGFSADLDGHMDHSAHTLTPVRLCAFPRANFLNLVRDHPELAIRLTWIIAHNAELGRDHLTSVGRRSARERVAHFLLELFYRVRLRESEAIGSTIELPLTQEHIADALGLTAVHVNRMLRGLREDGLIEVERHKLHVVDPDRLADIAGFDDDMFDRLMDPGPHQECPQQPRRAS